MSNLINSSDILLMPDRDIMYKLKDSKYPGYRLGDVIRAYPVERETYQRLLKQHLNRYPDSIAVKYTRLYNEKKSFQEKKRDNLNYETCLEIILNLCDEIDVEKPTQNDLIVPIRLGNMIDHNSENYSGRTLANKGGTFKSPSGGARKILSYHDITEKAAQINAQKIILVGGKSHIKNGRSQEYLRSLCELIQDHFKCEWYCAYSPDEDLAFMSHAKHIMRGPGGFCEIVYDVSNYRQGVEV